jgi:hypothetical protein
MTPVQAASKRGLPAGPPIPTPLQAAIRALRPLGARVIATRSTPTPADRQPLAA